MGVKDGGVVLERDLDRVSAVVDGGVFWDREEWWEFSRVQFAMTKRIDFNF